MVTCTSPDEPPSQEEVEDPDYFAKKIKKSTYLPWTECARQIRPRILHIERLHADTAFGTRSGEGCDLAARHSQHYVSGARCRLSRCILPVSLDTDSLWAVQKKVEKMEDDLALERGDEPPKRKREKPKTDKQHKEEEMHKLALKVCPGPNILGYHWREMQYQRALNVSLTTSTASACVLFLRMHDRWRNGGTKGWKSRLYVPARRSGMPSDQRVVCVATDLRAKGWYSGAYNKMR